jgi:hypothetical protein
MRSTAEGAAWRARSLLQLRRVVDAAPSFIRRMPLLVLSRGASFLYSEDSGSAGTTSRGAP